MKESLMEKWIKFYSKEKSKLKMYPSEELIRIFKGNYVEKLHTESKNILDIGFGNGENFILYNDLGMNIFGVEISEKICNQVHNRFEKLGIKTVLKEGTNTNIPFAENFFDYIVSWNVIHYENTEESINIALKEYRRVLKPEGMLILATVGENHSIKKYGYYIEKNIFLVKRKDDFRYGHKFYFFENEKEIYDLFKKYFNTVKVGRSFQNLFNEDKILDFFLVIAKR